MAFEAGKNKSVLFTVSGGSEITYSVIEHSWKEAVDALDITSSGHAGIQALLAGIFRGDGRVKCKLQTGGTQQPWSAANGIRAGNNGVMKFYWGTALFHQVPALIKEVSYMSTVASAIEWEANVGLNAEAGTFANPS
jgi:hypothetical protein